MDRGRGREGGEGRREGAEGGVRERDRVDRHTHIQGREGGGGLANTEQGLYIHAHNMKPNITHRENTEQHNQETRRWQEINKPTKS